MAIKFVEGDPGDGKTLYSVIEAHLRYWMGWNVGANINLPKIPYKRIHDIDDLMNLGPGSWFILLDEFWQTMDARRSMSLLNIETRRWGLQHRKTADKIEVWMTHQYESQMDVSICNIVKDRYYPRCVLREIPDDEDSPPVFLQILHTHKMRDRLNRNRYFLPVVWDTDCGPFDMLKAYNTFETVDPLTAKHEAEVKVYPKKYARFLKKSDLVIYLMKAEQRCPSEAKYIADYVMMERRGLLQDV